MTERIIQVSFKPDQTNNKLHIEVPLDITLDELYEIIEQLDEKGIDQLLAEEKERKRKSK